MVFLNILTFRIFLFLKSQTMFVLLTTQRLYGKCWLTLFREEPGSCGTSITNAVNSGVMVNINLQDEKSGVRKKRDWNNQSYFCETSARFLLFWVGFWSWFYIQTALGNCNSAIRYHWHLALVWGVGRNRAKAAWQWERTEMELSKAGKWPAIIY